MSSATARKASATSGSNWLPEQRDLDAYFLGPKPFMAQVKKQLAELGVPQAQCRYEFFGPAAALEA